MPWYNIITGEQVHSPSDEDMQTDLLEYKPSIYTKEELPTWSEVYEEFYLGKQFRYNPYIDDHQTMDPYWKIPHKKYLIAVICNQFNKMLYEDMMMPEITEKLSKKLNIPIKSLQFIFGSIEKTQQIHELSIEEFFKDVYEIYTVPLPTGKENPFIISNHNRVDVSKIDDYLFLLPVMDMSISTDKRISTPDEYRYIFHEVIEVMIEKYKEYFEGEDIGWKDSDGKVIEGDISCRTCTGAGYEVK